MEFRCFLSSIAELAHIVLAPAAGGKPHLFKLLEPSFCINIYSIFGVFPLH